jgi:hypothetical protein
MKLWNKFVMVGLLLTMGLIVSGMPTFARTDNHSLGDADREVVRVKNTADLLANIGRDNIDLVLAPKVYEVPACPEEVDEAADPTCGQMQQGDNSVLRSDLSLELDQKGVPTGKAHGGAIIDCSGLPPSALEFSCLVAGDGSTIRNLTIRDGLTTPEPDPPGGDPAGPDNRNGIMIVAGKEAVVDEVRLLNTRRGVLFTTESGKKTEGVVRHSLVEGTELAGIFLFAITPDFSPTSNSQLKGEIEANRLTNIGRFPLLLIGISGIDNDSYAEFTENIVDSSNSNGITILGESFPAAPAQDNSSSFKVEGGRLEGSRGLSMIMTGPGSDNSDNCLVGEVEGLTIENGDPAVEAYLSPEWGTGNKVLFEMKESVYTSAQSEAGKVMVTDDDGSNFQIVGTPDQFLENNTNFDISSLSEDDFTGDDNARCADN